MSEEEDEMILEEIRALENALSRQNNEKPDDPLGDNRNNLKTEVINFHERSNDEIEEIQVIGKISRHSPVPESGPFVNIENISGASAIALELNKKLIERLMATREEVEAILEECRRKKEIAGQKLKQRLKTGTSIKTLSSHAGMPYFKDKNFFAAPSNEDTKLKEVRGELQIIHLRRVSRWTARDKQLLLKAIFNQVIEHMKYYRGNEKIDFQSIKLGKNNTLPDIVVKEIGSLGEKEFDWMKIAVTDFQNKHSPDECRVMWKIFLHPSINKYKWKKKEITDLEKYVKEYKKENWDAIAEKLDTQRSGYQCFVKYNTIRKEPQNDKPWTKQEDRKLVLLVNKFKIGDFINWGDIASCVKTRTKHQIYFRWMYSLAPHLKKGRFTEEEDKLLSDAIEKYGLNFKKISALILPARTSAQLSDHYNTLTNKEDNIWTIDQDMKLLTLHQEHGTDWAKIATYFKNKSRVQLRHRRTALTRYQQRGVTLYQIPRNNFRDKATIKDAVVFQKVPVNAKMKGDVRELDDIDREIIKYFQTVNVPMTKAGRKKKFYTPSELESYTRQMYNILNLMSANLNIPSDLDGYDGLTEMDKQLLYALKNLPSNAVNGSLSQKIEKTRLKMFQNRDSDDEGKHFIPPLPFGGHMKTNKSNQMINYSLYIDTIFTENRDMKLTTPEEVIKVIGETVNNQYDKFAELVVSPCEMQKKRAYQKIYILGPNELMKKETCHNKSIHNLFQSLPSTSRVTSVEKRPTIPSVTRQTLNDVDMHNFPSIKPSYWSLLGYQGIESVRKTVNVDVRIDDEELNLRVMLEKGRRASLLLRTRLVQLFKFPIIMSQIMPPESLEDRECIFVSDQASEKASASSGRKRKMIKEEPE